MRDHPDTLMLFAAGLGTRMGRLVDHLPKPLLPVNNRPLIDHALDVVSDAGVQNVVVNTHYKSDLIERHLAGRNVQISHEYPILLETGGGLKNALPMIGAGPVFTLNSDAVWQGKNPLSQLANAWDSKIMDGLLLLIPLDRAFGHSGNGDFGFSGKERQLTRGSEFVYSGAQITSTSDLDNIHEQSFSLNRVWDTIENRGRLCGIVYDGYWCDVGRPEGIEAAEKMISAVPNV